MKKYAPDQFPFDQRKRPSFIPAARFHVLTPIFDLACTLCGLGKRYRTWILKNIAFPKNAVVLDAGCGSGTLAGELKENEDIVGIPVSFFSHTKCGKIASANSGKRAFYLMSECDT